MKTKSLLFCLLFCILGCLEGYAQKLTIEPYEPGEGLSLTQNGNSLRFSGFIQPMVESRFYNDTNASGVYNRFRMRRMVTRLTGKNARYNINYQIQIDLTGSSDGGGDATTNNYLMDAWISWRPIKQLNIKFGQEGSNTDTREMGMRSNALQMVERSPVSLAFSSIREFGLFLESKVRTGNFSFLATSFSVTNGDGANVFGNDFGGLKYGGRVDFIPFGNFNNAGQYRQADIEYEITPKLVVGGYYCYNYGISDRRGRQSGTILYQDSLGKTVLPDYHKFGFDFLFKYRGFSLLGEFVNGKANVPSNIFYRVRTNQTTTTDFSVNGVQNMPDYVRGRIITGSGLNLQGGYVFKSKYSLDGRYSVMMPDASSFLRNATFNQRSKFYTLCLSKYFGRHYGSKIQLSGTYTKLEPGALSVIGTKVKGAEFTGNLMFTIAL